MKSSVWIVCILVALASCGPQGVILECSADTAGHEVRISWRNAAFGLCEIRRDGTLIVSLPERTGIYIDRPGPGLHAYYVEDGMEWCGPLTAYVPYILSLPVLMR